MLFISNKFKKVLTITCLVTSMLLLSFVNYQTGYGAVYFNGSTRRLPIYRVNRNDNKIAISFDCAYGNEYTSTLLYILDEYKVKCTFFTVEFWTNKFSSDILEIDRRGHEIGTHSKTHPNMSKLSKEQIITELTSSSQAITNITNKKVEVFRPPYGDYDNLVIDTSNELGLYPIQWDVDSLDWKDLSVKQIVDRVVKRVKSGSIILCHNNGKNTAKALPYILGALIEKGYSFLPIGELIYKNNYTINCYGEQIKN